MVHCFQENLEFYVGSQLLKYPLHVSGQEWYVGMTHSDMLTQRLIALGSQLLGLLNPEYPMTWESRHNAFFAKLLLENPNREADVTVLGLLFGGTIDMKHFRKLNCSPPLRPTRLEMGMSLPSERELRGLLRDVQTQLPAGAVRNNWQKILPRQFELFALQFPACRLREMYMAAHVIEATGVVLPGITHPDVLRSEVTALVSVARNAIQKFLG